MVRAFLSRRRSQLNGKEPPRSLVAEELESRRLMNAALNSSILPVGVAAGSAATTIDLSTHFSDPTVTGTAVDITTPEGVIPLALTDAKTPKTVANFLQYIQTGEYQSTILHRLVAGFVVQGGGYTTREPTSLNSPQSRARPRHPTSRGRLRWP